MQSKVPAAPPCEFVIVTLPRSGSYHLSSLLDSAGDIVCHGEIFKPNFVELRPFYLKKLQYSESKTQIRDTDRVKFVNNLRSINPKKIFGFKAFPDHLLHDQPIFDFVLKNPKWRKIFLFRNPIESYSSLLRANDTGIWVVEDKTANTKNQLQSKVLFQPDSFRDHLRLCDWLEQIFLETKSISENKCYRVDYKDLSSREKLQDILKFLGSGSFAVDLHSKFYRQFGLPTQQGFSNWATFEKFLVSNELTHLLADLENIEGAHSA